MVVVAAAGTESSSVSGSLMVAIATKGSAHNSIYQFRRGSV